MNHAELTALLIKERKTIDPELAQMLSTGSAPIVALLRQGVSAWAEKLAADILGPVVVYRVTVSKHDGAGMINGIKALRQWSGNLGLKEAKDITEGLRDGTMVAQTILTTDDENAAEQARKELIIAGFNATVIKKERE